MIPFDFDYYKPTSIQEAAALFTDARERGENVIYYSGGTEFITFARVNKMHADVVIDLKGILECNVVEIQGDQLCIGAGISLNNISELNLFPLLGETVKQIADHTSRNKITIGGNMNSRLIYRESLLPLFVADAKVRIAGNKEDKVVPLEAVFNKEIKLKQREFLVQIFIDTSYINLPFVSLKKTRMTKVGYPVVSIAALVKDKQLRIAFSGICDYPFRSAVIEKILNDTSLSEAERIDKAVAKLPAPVVQDVQASAAYRMFVVKNMLSETLEILEGVK